MPFFFQEAVGPTKRLLKHAIMVRPTKPPVGRFESLSLEKLSTLKATFHRERKVGAGNTLRAPGRGSPRKLGAPNRLLIVERHIIARNCRISECLPHRGLTVQKLSEYESLGRFWLQSRTGHHSEDAGRSRGRVECSDEAILALRRSQVYVRSQWLKDLATQESAHRLPGNSLKELPSVHSKRYRMVSLIFSRPP